MARVCIVADWDVVEVEETIWAFCLITSAGVRMAQETSSAIEEAALCCRGAGRMGWFARRDFAPS